MFDLASPIRWPSISPRRDAQFSCTLSSRPAYVSPSATLRYVRPSVRPTWAHPCPPLCGAASPTPTRQLRFSCWEPTAGDPSTMMNCYDCAQRAAWAPACARRLRPSGWTASATRTLSRLSWRMRAGPSCASSSTSDAGPTGRGRPSAVKGGDKSDWNGL